MTTSFERLLGGGGRLHLVMEVPQDSGMATLRSTTPVLASLDIAKTIEFYVSELGFEKVYGEQKQYGVVSRDDISIHFWACSDPEIAKATFVQDSD